MKPGIFPFTCMSFSTLKKIYDVFGQCIVYQPLSTQVPEPVKDASNGNMIRIHTPFKEIEDKIGGAFNEYREWANMNKGSAKIGRGIISNTREIAPFFTETSVSQIRADFKTHNDPKKENDTEAMMFDAGLFAAIAGEYDLHNQSLESDLKSLKKLEANLTRTLKGHQTSSIEPDDMTGLSWSGDLGAYMTAERIKAWCTLFLKDENRPDFFVTTSRAVVDFLSEKENNGFTIVEQAVVGKVLNGSEKDEKNFLDAMEALAVSDNPDAEQVVEKSAFVAPLADEAFMNISIHMAINQRPETFFKPFCRPGLTDDSAGDSAGRVKHTILCCVEI